MNAIGILICLPGWLFAVDAIRRPAWQWRYANRNRVFWAALLIIFSPLFVIPYALIAFPKLLNASQRGNPDSLYGS